MQAFAENRCLELGKGNEEVAFDRAACLEVNSEIIEMAQAGNGLSLYFKADGLYKLGDDGLVTSTFVFQGQRPVKRFPFLRF